MLDSTTLTSSAIQIHPPGNCKLYSSDRILSESTKWRAPTFQTLLRVCKCDSSHGYWWTRVVNPYKFVNIFMYYHKKIVANECTYILLHINTTTHVALSYCCVVVLWYCRIVILICRVVLSYCFLVVLWYCCIVILFCCVVLSYCCVVVLQYCHVVILFCHVDDVLIDICYVVVC